MAGKLQRQSQEVLEDVIHLLDHALRGAALCEQALRSAEQAGDKELSTLLREGQLSQHHLAEQAKLLLATRLARPAPEAETVHARPPSLRGSAGAPTNAQVASGGREGDDLVDEQSKESFPASDAPAHY